MEEVIVERFDYSGFHDKTDNTKYNRNYVRKKGRNYVRKCYRMFIRTILSYMYTVQMIKNGKKWELMVKEFVFHLHVSHFADNMFFFTILHKYQTFVFQKFFFHSESHLPYSKL